LNINGYIKHRLVEVLIDSGSTHNFIHRRIVEETHCFVYPSSNFQILVVNGGTMKFGSRCENSKLQMGNYPLKTHMLSISIGSCDIVLGVEWFCNLGPITMNYQELYMSLHHEAHTYTLQGLYVGSHEIISFHRMEKMLKKGHHGCYPDFGHHDDVLMMVYSGSS
jgi:hypothetical protein